METGNMETGQHGDKETWGHRHETLRHGDIGKETWAWRHGHGEMETRTWRQNQTGNGSLGHFPSSVYRVLSCKRKFFIFLFVDKETTGSYPFANGQN